MIDMNASRMGWTGLGLVLSLVAFAGCTQSPVSTPDDVVLYLKMMRLGGTPRPLSPQCKTYVDNILAADAKVRASLADLIRVRDGDYLWPGDAPQWFDAAAIEKQLTALDKIIDQEAPARAAALKSLTEAIDRIPPGLLGKSDSERIFRDAVWTALKWEYGDLRYLETALMPLVAKHKLLYAHALKRAAEISPQAGGWLDDPKGRDVVELFFELRLDVLAKREAAEDILEQDITEADKLIVDLNSELKGLQEDVKTRAATDADRHREQWINDLIAYETRLAARDRELKAVLEKQRAADAAAAEQAATTQPGETASQPANP